jgi:hypothetical protein
VIRSGSEEGRGTVKDRLDKIGALIETAAYAGEVGELKELHLLILEELKMLRERTDSWERFIGSLRKEFQ